MYSDPRSREITGRPFQSNVIFTRDPVTSGSATCSTANPSLTTKRLASDLPFHVIPAQWSGRLNSLSTLDDDHFESSNVTSRQFSALCFEHFQLPSVRIV